ncbi:hypothetical protein [Variovorax sp. W2I14]|uniref:hypothetical protein n=1 Tax=Variovorax sp. W2I14 TaxID=3042290 RepID=UPI003D23F9A1
MMKRHQHAVRTLAQTPKAMPTAAVFDPPPLSAALFFFFFFFFVAGRISWILEGLSRVAQVLKEYRRDHGGRSSVFGDVLQAQSRPVFPAKFDRVSQNKISVGPERRAAFQ